MGKYLESEEEKRINYLRRKLLQWNTTAKKLTKEINSSKVARWIERTYKTSVARNDWKKLTDKYDMFINKTALYQLKTRLSNWLKLRDMAEKLRIRFTKVGTDQLKEGIEFKKILVLMRTLFENWDERNKFLAKRFFITLTDNVNTLADISTTHKYLKAVPVARASDFFNKLRKAWGDWSKIRIRILEIMGKYLESEEEKRINYLRRKLLQWNNTAKNLTKEINSSKIARWTERTYKTAVARNDWKKLTDKYDMFINKTALYQLKTRLSN